MNTEIKSCTCNHAFQDKMYGKGKRVMNETNRAQGKPVYRCTVCLAEKV